MKQLFMRGFLLALLGLGATQQAYAHVAYTDITNVGAAGLNDAFNSYGWAQGQVQPVSSAPQGALATTDDVNWYSFSLTAAAEITLTLTSVNDGTNPALAAPAFSLYSGVLVTDAWDDSIYAPLPAGQRGAVNTAQSFGMTLQTDSTGADWRVIDFLGSATDGGTGTAQLARVLLGPGDYTVIAGGNTPYVADEAFPAFQANIALTAVPLPGAFWLMSAAMAGLGFIGRGKNRFVA